MRKPLSALVLASLLSWNACSAPPAESAKETKAGGSSPTQAMTKDLQQKVTPDRALQMLKEGNRRFRSGELVQRNLPAMVKQTGSGQYPFASIVCCLDSRSGPELVFDQGIGDVFCARVAGNIVNEDILGSLEFGSKVAGSKLIVVLGHTSCGAVKGACDDVTLGNLTGLLTKIKPALATIPDDGQGRTSKNPHFVEQVAEANVKLTVRAIRDHSPILKEMEDHGDIRIVGAMLDVTTGEVTWY